MCEKWSKFYKKHTALFSLLTGLKKPVTAAGEEISSIIYFCYTATPGVVAFASIILQRGYLLLSAMELSLPTHSFYLCVNSEIHNLSEIVTLTGKIKAALLLMLYNERLFH